MTKTTPVRAPDQVANPTRMQHQPALDGLRGLAVIAVIAFHARAGWMSGGYIGVSVFFTLSGFLITTLLIREHRLAGTISLSGFYGRRARRLLPASLMTIAGVAVAARAGWFANIAHVRSDLIGALLQVSNWTQLLRGGSYADQITARAGITSPLVHFWSLSIEEQYYWIWPLAMIGLFGVCRRSNWQLHRLLVASAIGCSAVAVIVAWRWGAGAAYWSTPSRAAEILVGAALAGLVEAKKLPPIPVKVAAAAGLALIACCIWLPTDHGLAYVGGLPLVAVASAILLGGLQSPGRLATVIGITPLRLVGTLSYGLYVFHWPIFVALRTGTRLAGMSLVGAELAITLVVTVASYLLVERLIRRATFTVPRGLALAGLATTCAVAAIFAVPSERSPYWSVTGVDDVPLTAGEQPSASRSLNPLSLRATDRHNPLPSPSAKRGDEQPRPAAVSVAAGAPAAGAVATGTPATGAPATGVVATGIPGTGIPTAGVVDSSPATDIASPSPGAADVTAGAAQSSGSVPAQTDPPTTSTAPLLAASVPPPQVPRPVRILVVGDSTAEATGVGLLAWSHANPQLAVVALAVFPGCGLITGGIALNDADRRLRTGCDRILTQRFPTLVRTFSPDIVVVLVTQRDEEPQNFGQGVIPISDPVYHQRLDASYRSFVTTTESASSATIVFTKMPTINGLWLGAPAASTDVVARDAYEAELATIARQDPSRVQLLDFRAWVVAENLETDHLARPDGVHWSPAAATDIVTRWFGPTLMGIAVQAG